MTPADVRLTAQLVAAGRVHSVSDEAVMAMARRVLELEMQVEHWATVATQAALAIGSEREACAKAAEREVSSWWGEARRTIGVRVVEAIRARGEK